MSTSALASLTATYTDSEGEDDDFKDKTDSSPKGSKSPPDTNSDNRSTTSSRPGSPGSNPSVTVTSRLKKLVSYHDDTIVSDDEGNEDIPQQLIYLSDSIRVQEEISFGEDDHMIPPEPLGACSAELQDKISKLYEKMQTQQMDMNAVIQKRKDFRNPSIYEKLIQFCELNEMGTNYPASIYDPHKWSKESYYEELAKVQKAEMDKREKARKAIQDLPASLKKMEEDKKRKSKWDMPGGNAVKINQPGLVNPPSLTSSATGTKSTVISAFGSLPKKKI